MKITSTIKVAEFAEVTDALLKLQQCNYETREPLLDLIQAQTEAKQNKFWAFYDGQTMYCQYDYCNKRKWKYEMVDGFCDKQHKHKQLEIDLFNLLEDMKEGN